MKLFLCVFGLIAAIATAATANAQALFQDNFDKDPTGSFPAGWTLIYDGAGPSLQIVDNTESYSKPNSLRLVGSSCWGANAYHPVSLPGSGTGKPQHVRLSAKVFVGEIGVGGCDRLTAFVGFINPAVGAWGTLYGDISFFSDGFIYTNSQAASPLKLVPYHLNNWYSVVVDADFTAQTSDLYINGSRVASGLPFPSRGEPTGIEVSAGHGTTPIAWFDDMLVTSDPTVADWKFDEAGGSAFIDSFSAAAANNGALINGLSRSAKVHSGKGNSLIFNDPAETAVIPDSPSLRPTELTLEAWINPNVGAHTIISKQLGTTCCAYSYQLQLNPFQFQLTDKTGAKHVARSAAGPTANAWHHVAGTFDGQNIKLYLDKKLVASGVLNREIAYDENPLLIGGADAGRGIPGCCAYSGLIEEVRISSEALAPTAFLP